MTNTETTTTRPAAFTDEALFEAMDSGLPGLRRRAALLLEVPEAHRPIYSAEARYVGNMVPGGRPSDTLARVIHAGLARLTSPLAKGLADKL